MAVGEHHGRVGMDLAVLQPRHPVVHAAGQLANFRVKRTAVRDAHLLKAAADAEDRHAAFDTGLDERECQRIPMMIVRLVLRVLLEPEPGGVDVGARAGEQDAVDRVEQGADIGDLGRAGEHQRQRAGDLGDRPQVALADHLSRKPVLDDVHIGDDADGRFAFQAAGAAHPS